MRVPPPLTKGKLCQDCKGTGANIERTLQGAKSEPKGYSYIVCWACNGRGLDPAEYFTWSTKEKKK